MKYLGFLWLAALAVSLVLSTLETRKALAYTYCYRPAQVPACTPPPNWNYCNPSTP